MSKLSIQMRGIVNELYLDDRMKILELEELHRGVAGKQCGPVRQDRRRWRSRQTLAW